MKYNISQAARIVGVSRKTFYTHIAKKGISIELDDDKNKLVDASELVRIYGDKCNFEGREHSKETPPTIQEETPVNTPDQAIEIARLQEQLNNLEEQRDLFKELYEQEKTERQNGVKLLADQREKQDRWETLFEQVQQQLASENKQFREFKQETKKQLIRHKRALQAERNEKPRGKPSGYPCRYSANNLS